METELTLDELIVRLDKSVSDKTAKAALEKACLLVERDAKKLAPVGRTGELRRSIHHSIEGNVGYVGSNLEYAPYVEFGTGIYAVNGDGRQTPWTYYDEREKQFYTTDGMVAQPYLYPALQQNEEEIGIIFSKAIEEALDGK